ncbi:hypothetical protein Acel_0770 [Acidothermus cellulolyticus 11B]|uniref:Uncharacterized protein n=2 Tax=Acidothermus cellulolyticus TaxID=28049 RepID=A0LSY3_ACIC1|nr:hypothetical protein Acel_0770 [Acidothermus cellulolyticus 11B]
MRPGRMGRSEPLSPYATRHGRCDTGGAPPRRWPVAGPRRADGRLPGGPKSCRADRCAGCQADRKAQQRSAPAERRRRTRRFVLLMDGRRDPSRPTPRLADAAPDPSIDPTLAGGADAAAERPDDEWAGLLAPRSPRRLLRQILVDLALVAVTLVLIVLLG